MTPIGLSLADVGDVYLHHGNVDGPDAVGQSDGSVGVSSWVYDHAIVIAISFLKLIDQATLMVRLVVIQLYIREFSL